MALAASPAAAYPPGITVDKVQSIDLVRYYAFREGAWSIEKHDESADNHTNTAPTWNNIMRAVDGHAGTATNTGMWSIVDHASGGPCDGIPCAMINFSFPVKQNLTSIAAAVGSAACTNRNFYMWVRNDTGALLEQVHWDATECSTHTMKWINGTWPNVKNITFALKQPTGGGLDDNLVLNAFHAWDKNNKTFPIEHAYADYLVRIGQRTSDMSGATGTAARWAFRTADFQVPAGEGWYYSNILLKDGGCLGLTTVPDNSGTNICYHFLIPTSASSDLTFTLHGASYVHNCAQPNDPAECTPPFAIWRYKNTASAARTASLQNSSLSAVAGGCSDAGENCMFRTNWFFQTYNLFASCPSGKYNTTTPAENSDCKASSGVTTMPHGNASCTAAVTAHDCTSDGAGGGANRFVPYFGFGYKDNSGPFATIAFPSMGWNALSGVLIDLRNITTVAHPKAADIADDGNFQISLDASGAYVGNVLYLMLAKYSPTNICDVTNSTIQVNGVDTELGIQTFDFNDIDSQFIQYCGWIIDDLARGNGLKLNAQTGNYDYFDNNVTGRLYDINLPGNLRYDNWRAVQSFRGTHAARTQCSSDLGICFGNYDTTGIDVPGVKQTVNWEWTVRDADTNQTLEGVKVFEVVTSTGGLTDANGRINITTTTTKVQWSLTKQGYGSQVINMTRIAIDYVTVNASMTKAFSSKPMTEVKCSVDNSTALECTTAPTADASKTCQELEGTDGHCRKGPIFGVGLKVFEFGCPRDISSQQQRLVANVSVHESVTAQSLVIGTTLPSTDVTYDCLAGSTTLIQSQNVAFTFAKPGFQTIAFSANWLANTVIRITPMFKTGDGQATVSVSSANTTVIHGGVAKPATLIVLTTTNAAEATILDESSGIAPWDLLLVNLGTGLGASTTGSKILYGIVLLFMLLFAVVIGWKKVSPDTDDGLGYVVGGAFVLGFLGIGYMGLWPAEVLIMGIFALVAGGVLVFKSRREA